MITQVRSKISIGRSRGYAPNHHMPNRRHIMALAMSLALCSRTARAQHPTAPIGLLRDSGVKATSALLAALWSGMKLAGVDEHGDIISAQSGQQSLQASARELIARRAAIIIADGLASALAAKSASSIVPIVFVSAVDPVAAGLVATNDRPGGNITGISLTAPELLAERFERLHQLAPESKKIAALVNPEAHNFDVQLQYLNDSAVRRGIKIELLFAGSNDQLGNALNRIAPDPGYGLLVANDDFLNGHQDRLIAFAAAKSLPAAFSNREFVEAGGLMSYGPSLIDAYRAAGTYAARIIRGESCADLPVLNPVEMELAINAATAKTLGLHIPAAMAASAGELVD
jgi:putative tryptophan/tyrosine transport system substrate-binding protein